MDKIIAKILDIEKQARQIVDEAQAQSADLETEVDAQLVAYRADCRRHAQAHIDEIRTAEWKNTEDEFDRLGAEYKRKNAELDAWEARNFGRWLDGLLAKARY